MLRVVVVQDGAAGFFRPAFRPWLEYTSLLPVLTHVLFAVADPAGEASGPVPLAAHGDVALGACGTGDVGGDVLDPGDDHGGHVVWRRIDRHGSLRDVLRLGDPTGRLGTEVEVCSSSEREGDAGGAGEDQLSNFIFHGPIIPLSALSLHVCRPDLGLAGNPR